MTVQTIDVLKSYFENGKVVNQYHYEDVFDTMWSLAGAELWVQDGDDIYYMDGMIGIGTDSPSRDLTIVTDGTTTRGLQIEQYINNAGYASLIVLRKSRSDTVEVNVALQDADVIGNLGFEAADGTSYLEAAGIRATIDGSVSTGITPSALVFRTQDDTGSVAERMRLSPEGYLHIGGEYAQSYWSSVSNHLTIAGDGGSDQASAGGLALVNNCTAPTATNPVGVIEFLSVFRGSGSGQQAAIAAIYEGSGGTNGLGARLGFWTKDDNVAWGLERMSLLCAGGLEMKERISDPSNPAEGKWVIWMSDGTGAGDDGDILIKITAGGTTKTATLVDFSTL